MVVPATGAVVVVRFPFSDLSGTKLFPALSDNEQSLGRPWRDCDHIRRFCRRKSAPGQLCATGQALYRKSKSACL